MDVNSAMPCPPMGCGGMLTQNEINSKSLLQSFPCRFAEQISQYFAQLEVPLPTGSFEVAVVCRNESCPLPSQNLLTIPSSVSTQSGCSFKHGINLRSAPPASRNVSRPRIPISSMVSRQSETKEGQITSSFLTPRAASLGNS